MSVVDVIPTLFQIETMFQSNGFRLNNVITRSQLLELFNHQHMRNNYRNEGPNEFDMDLFEEIWGHLELLSDSSVKIQSVCEVLHEAMVNLKSRINVISGSEGISQKEKELQKMLEKEQELIQELDLIDNDYNEHENQLKTELQALRKCISKILAQIKELEGDSENFEFELNMLIMVVGQQFMAPVEAMTTKFVPENIHGTREQRVESSALKLIFILAVVCFLLELIVSMYRLGLGTITALVFVFYLLFLGYYNDNTAKYLIIFMVLSILMDGGFLGLSLFTNLIISPLTHSSMDLVKYVVHALIGVSMVLRVVILINLSKYVSIPRKIEYFTFWGEQVVLNRRSKNLIKNQMHFNGSILDDESRPNRSNQHIPNDTNYRRVEDSSEN